MHAYRVMINEISITKVWGRDKTEAMENANRQLDRPGRYGILKEWQAGGSELQIVLDGLGAIKILTERESVTAVEVLEAAVSAKCQTNAAGIQEWLAAGDYDGSETVEGLAEEWDCLNE